MTDIRKMVKEEVRRMVFEAKENAPAIEKKLEELRKKFKDDMSEADGAGGQLHRKAKKVAIRTVCDLTQLEINELVLYFLNNVKTKNDRSLVEYHAGLVYFYADSI